MKHTIASMAWGVLLLLVSPTALLAEGSDDPVHLPTEYISVGDFTGNADRRINAAIDAAMATEHKTVFLPNGVYALRSTLNLNRGPNTELHLVGESRDGVFLIPDIPHLQANYNDGRGARLAHMINLSSESVFESVDVSIQNMTVDMRHPQVMGEPVTYRVLGHGIRVGTGWEAGRFTVNHVTIRNVGSYGIGIQDRGGHPKNNVTLTNIHIERTGSDGIDTKEASGDGNRNLVIRNLSVNEIGFLDTGAAIAIDVRYRDAVIENVNLVSLAWRSTLPGQRSNTTAIFFRSFQAGAAGIVRARVSGVYIRGFANAVTLQASDHTPHANIRFTDFRIHGHRRLGVRVLGTNHSDHRLTNGAVFADRGNRGLSVGQHAEVNNVTRQRWDPALNPMTDTTVERNVSLAGETFSPAWPGIVGAERLSLNPTSPATGPLVVNVTNTGVMQIDFDAAHNAMDRLIVDGTLRLDGVLRINIVNGRPAEGGTYQIFEADSITGSFDTIRLPDVAGMTWDTQRLATDGTISLRGQ